jgi:hypothetical protein
MADQTPLGLGPVDSSLEQGAQRFQRWEDGQEIERLRFENWRLQIENWQLRGALGYQVPGNIPPGDFKCGLCESRDYEHSQSHNIGIGISSKSYR